jgi:hypothetical protein
VDEPVDEGHVCHDAVCGDDRLPLRRIGVSTVPSAALPDGLSCRLETPHELNHASYLVAGLSDLAREGVLDLRWRLATRPRPGVVRVSGSDVVVDEGYRPFKTSYLEVERAGRVVRAAVDFWDLSDQFAADALRHCDVVLKREFDSAVVEGLATRFPARVVPAGLTHRAPLPRPGRVRLQAAFAAATARRLVKLDRRVVGRARDATAAVVDGLRMARHVPSLTGRRPAGGRSGVLFQTRTFPAGEGMAELHGQRADLIRALRAGLGPEFQGGFVPSRTAGSDHGDLMSTVPADPERYLDAVQRAAVVVSSAGVAGSTPWKLAEFLALGTCIVAERPRTTLPDPLVDGVHARFFDTPAEAVESCRALLADGAERERLAEAGRGYYQAHVRPAVAVRRWLGGILQLAEDP